MWILNWKKKFFTIELLYNESSKQTFLSSNNTSPTINIEKSFHAKKSHAFEERFAVMNFYFDNPYVTKVTKDTKMSIYDKLVLLFLFPHTKCSQNLTV